MSREPTKTIEPDEPTIYHIRVRGHLGPRWAQWFDAMTLVPQPNGDTLLTGPLADQAALHGILKRIRDLGLPLISIEQATPDQPSNLSERSTT